MAVFPRKNAYGKLEKEPNNRISSHKNTILNKIGREITYKYCTITSYLYNDFFHKFDYTFL